MKKPTEKQIMAANTAHMEFSAKWRVRDFPAQFGRSPIGTYLIEEDPMHLGVPKVRDKPTVQAYRFNRKEERDGFLLQMMLEAIATAVVNA